MPLSKHRKKKGKAVTSQLVQRIPEEVKIPATIKGQSVVFKVKTNSMRVIKHVRRPYDRPKPLPE